MKSFFEILKIKRLRLKGQKLLTKGDFEKAFPVFQKAVLLDNSYENIYNLALCQTALGKYEDAEAYLDKINQEIPGNEMILLTLAETKLMQKKWQESIDHFQKLTEINPRSESYKKYLALSKDEVEREKYVSSKMLLFKATEALQQKKDEEALKLLIEADETYPENANILNNIGSIYMLMKDYKNAYKYFSEALKYDRNNQRIKENILAARRKIKK
ncbi:MAG: tetratricopeptide repeat protein [Candidatus Cloacimonetes bacterium]|nr:tetratricopeptide repeat protein [Candidatus Cloacimonadota bacterium]MCF7813231.1 tetratricopeptide repeat protein [Candidatus Cloacimonadota bacterium]MCF7867430.1 tetratricopeptide repeat protein [Candidatus Cloacimonadota bacterium]MCF7882938.1 tetratricopeptide repeat protein [Candidatus Cloacimonadota bacterium]